MKKIILIHHQQHGFVQKLILVLRVSGTVEIFIKRKKMYPPTVMLIIKCLYLR